MKNRKRYSRIVSILLTVVMVVASVLPSFAAEGKGQTRTTVWCSDNENEYAIYPIPQSITYDSNHTSFTLEDVAIVAESGIDSYTKAFLKEVLDDYNVTYTEVSSIQSGKTNILLGIEGSNGTVDTYANENIAISKSDLYAQNDAYMLDAKADCIVIEGKDTDSVFYGVATLQMMFSSFAGERFLNAHIEDYATVATRGYIEGFYGSWNFEERANLMRFARDYKMNSYVYAAKGDAYHTSKWADLYPADILASLQELVNVGRETKVEFAWSIHLGSFFGSFSSTSDPNYETQYAKLTTKLNQLIGIGVRKIDVLNDDFGSGSHETVVAVLNRLNTYLKNKGCEPLTYCPQGYNRAWSKDGSELAALRNLDLDINIYWTGDDVNAPITQSTVDFLTERSEHAPDYWLNYPVNEHAASGIFLGDITYYARDNVTGLAGFHSNPSRYAYANEVGLYQLAALVWNNNKYSDYAQEIWESAFNYLQPEVRDSYFKIASNISNAPNSGRVPGFNESEYLAEKIETVKAALDSSDSFAANATVLEVLQEFKDVIAAIADFRKNCANQDLVAELDPWLNSLNDLAHAGQDALESLIALAQDNPSAAWDNLSSASKSFDTAYTYNNEAGNVAKSGSKRLYPFMSTLINAAKNKLTPVLDPTDDTVTPVLYAKLGGTVRNADANGLKMYDGDDTSCATWNTVQQQGDYFGLDLGRVVPVRDIAILQGTSDTDHDIFHKARLEYSTDGESWTTIVDNSDGSANGHSISVDGLDIRARYVRYYLVATGTASKPDYWTHVREFTVNKKVEAHDRVYTNVESLKETPLTFEGAEVSVRNLNGLTLQAGQYIGIKLEKPTAVAAFVKEISNETGLTFEYSYNGLEWTTASTVENPVGVKYLRLINKTGAAVQTGITKIGMTLKNLVAEPTMLTTTTAGLAEGSYANIFDGDLATYALTSGAQVKDTYITFDLGKTIEVHDVEAVTSDGAQRFYNAKIQISNDNTAWTDVATVVDDNSVFEVPYRYVRGNGDGANARYMRIYFTGANSNPLKLFEIRINAGVEANTASAEIVSSMAGNLNAVVDKDISTLFAATAKAGDYLEYRISDNTNVTQVSVLQGTAGKGKAYAVTTSGKTLLGALDQSVSVFDTKDIAPITAVRIEWEEAEEVAIHQLSISRGADSSDDIGVYVEPIIISGGEEPISNIALGKAVTVSGTSDGNKDNVNDGDTSTKWDSNAIKQGTEDIGDSWICMDLGTEKEYEISQIVVRFFNKIYPTSWRIQVSDDAGEWNNVTEELTKENNGPAHPVETVDFETPVTGRYVRLYFNTLNTAAAGNGVGVTEFEIYGRTKKAVDKSALEALITSAAEKAESADYTEASKTALAEAVRAAQDVADRENATEQEVASALETLQSKVDALQFKVTEQQNIGLRRPVTVSGTSNGVKENINDGNPSSKWDGDYIKGAEANDESWVVIDLGEEANLIDELRISYFNKVYPTEYAVQISNDNTSWTTVKTLSKEHNGPTHPVDTIAFETPVSARYVRLLFTELNNVAAGNGVGINEAEVLGRYIYEEVSVQEAETFANIVAEKGSTFDSTQLADTAKVQLAVSGLNGNLAAYVPVSWNTSGLDMSTANTYTLEGSLSLNGVANNANVKASVNVIVEEDEPLPECTHENTSIVGAKEATCEVAGETGSVVCDDCHKVIQESQTIDALGHSYGAWSQTKAPTCTEKGVETRTCSRDSAHVETRDVEALGHDFGEWTQTKAPTCTEKGEETRTCSHDSAHVETRDVDALGHDFGEWTQTKAPTCTEKGEETRTCSHDSTHVETREIPATGKHTYGEWVVVKEATKEEAGLEKATCTCGDEITREIPKLPATEEDKQESQKYFEECQSYYSEEKYSATTNWKAYTAAMEALKAVLADDTATLDEIAQAVAAVEAAAKAMNAEVEQTPDTPEPPVVPEKPATPEKPDQGNVQTGDTASMMIWIMLIVTAGVVLIIKKRKVR